MDYVETRSAPAVERELATDVLELAGDYLGIPTEGVVIKWLARPVLEPAAYDRLTRHRIGLDHGEVGRIRLAEPGTIWLTVGMRSRDICATVVHELAHVGQLRGGRTDPSTDAEDETEARALERSFMDWLER